MIALLLSILASTGVFILFRSFEKYHVNTLQALTVNYIVAFGLGLWHHQTKVHWSQVIETQWFYGALILGFLFISIYYVMALTARMSGISATSIATKMSVIIPIIFGIFVYNESHTWLKISGIGLAFVAVYLASKKSKAEKTDNKNFVLPFVLFLGSGIIDTTMKYLETTYVEPNGIPLFSSVIFSAAAVIGIIVVLIKSIQGQMLFTWQNLMGGVLLGIVNYASVYFLLRALQSEHLESSSLFSVNNVAIVMLSTLVGLWFFKEQLSKRNWIGFGLAILSILLVTLSQ